MALRPKATPVQQIADFGSRIGFKGHEHLGNNLNAIWQVENSVNVAGGGDWAGRESFIGLEGNFGKIRAGKLETQLKSMDSLDPWEYSNNALGLGMFQRTGERIVSVKYDSPVWAGFSGNVQFTPRDNGTDVAR
jgi:major outer membrane protein P.IB